MTKRILHIAESLLPSGTRRQLELLADGLPHDEFELQIVSLKTDSATEKVFRDRGIETASVGRRGHFDARAFWKLRGIIRRTRPDVVHTWNFDANLFGRLAIRSTDRIRAVASERRVDSHKSGLARLIDQRLADRTDFILADSCAVRDMHRARGLPVSKLRLMPSGVPATAVTTVPRDDLVAEFGIPHDARLIAYLGPLTREKRLKELIWATDQLKAVGVPAHLLMIGDGPQRAALERYRFLNRIDDRVHFLGWRADIPRLLSHVEVVWQPGAHEGHSFAILEAMAAGIPVVAADAGGNRELISHGVHGYLVPVKERAGFARWTLPLLENTSLARQLGAAARGRVLQDFHLETMISAYANLYRSL